MASTQKAFNSTYYHVPYFIFSLSLVSCGNSNYIGDAFSEINYEQDIDIDTIDAEDPIDNVDSQDDISDSIELDFGHGIGSPCNDVSDCIEVEGNVACLEESTDGYCSLICETEEDCGLNSHCIDAFYGHYCYLSCKNDEDCNRPDYSCSGGENGVCFWGTEL